MTGIYWIPFYCHWLWRECVSNWRTGKGIYIQTTPLSETRNIRWKVLDGVAVLHDYYKLYYNRVSEHPGSGLCTPKRSLPVKHLLLRMYSVCREMGRPKKSFQVLIYLPIYLFVYLSLNLYIYVRMFMCLCLYVLSLSCASSRSRSLKVTPLESLFYPRNKD